MAALVGGVTQFGPATAGAAGGGIGSAIGSALSGAANTIGGALGGSYVNVSIPLSGQVAQTVPVSTTPIYYGGATTNTANTATTNNSTNNNAYANTTNNNEVNNYGGIGGVRYGTYSYTPPDPIQPKPLLGGLQAEGRAIAPNGVQLSDPGQGDINIARNYGGPVTGTLPAPSVSDPRVPLVQGRNTANTVQGSDQGYYASPGNVGSPQAPGLFPQGPQGIDPRVLQAYQNAQGVQNLYNIQQGMNPNLQNARNMQALAQMMAMQRMRGQQMPQAPQMLGNGPGWRNAMYRAAGGLNRNIAARNINAYNQQSANWREMYAQNQMNERDAFGHFATLAGQQMSAEQQIYNTGLTQAVELTKAAQQGATPAQIQEMMKYIVDNTTDPKSRQTMLNGIGNGLLATGAWTPDQVKGLMSISNVYSDKAAEMSQGRQVRTQSGIQKMQLTANNAELQHRKLAAQVGLLEFKNNTKEAQQALNNARTRAQTDAYLRAEINGTVNQLDDVLGQYQKANNSLNGLRGNIFMDDDVRNAQVAQAEKALDQTYGPVDPQTGVRPRIKQLQQQRDMWMKVQGNNASQALSAAPQPLSKLVAPPQATVPDLSAGMQKPPAPNLSQELIRNTIRDQAMMKFKKPYEQLTTEQKTTLSAEVSKILNGPGKK